MNKREFYKVLISAFLLVTLMLITLWSIYVEKNSTWCFPYYDKMSDEVSMNPKDTYCIPATWFIKNLSDKFMMVILVLILLLSPDFKRWKVSPIYAWIIYFLVWAIDYIFFFEAMKWMIEAYVILTFITVFYTAYFWYDEFLKKKVN